MSWSRAQAQNLDSLSPVLGCTSSQLCELPDASVVHFSHLFMLPRVIVRTILADLCKSLEQCLAHSKLYIFTAGGGVIRACVDSKTTGW